MHVYQTWINAISDNIANLNTVRPPGEPAYQERFVVASSAPGTAGANVDGIVFGPGDGQLVYQPDHPYADADGMVRVPGMDLSTQMTNLIVAQRAYQANVTAFERARDAYQRALEIGQP
jgi:flagellar basal-body rod protein FlgC